MSTIPLNNRNRGQSGAKLTRASIAAGVAAGAITTEAANLLYSRLADDSDIECDPIPVPTPIPEPINDSQSEPQPEPIPESISEPIPEPIPEPLPEPLPEPIPQPTSESVYSPASQPTSTIVSESESEPIPVPEPMSEDIVDVIVEEIDPRDIDMEDILLVDEIGTVYTVDGGEMNVALIHDSEGNQALLVDVDNNHVYDMIASPEGEMIAQVPVDIDRSDVELMYAQQHGIGGYMEPNDFDVAMNEEHSEIQNDISLNG